MPIALTPYRLHDFALLLVNWSKNKRTWVVVTGLSRAGRILIVTNYSELKKRRSGGAMGASRTKSTKLTFLSTLRGSELNKKMKVYYGSYR